MVFLSVCQLSRPTWLGLISVSYGSWRVRPSPLNTDRPTGCLAGLISPVRTRCSCSLLILLLFLLLLHLLLRYCSFFVTHRRMQLGSKKKKKTKHETKAAWTHKWTFAQISAGWSYEMIMQELCIRNASHSCSVYWWQSCKQRQSYQRHLQIFTFVPRTPWWGKIELLIIWENRKRKTPEILRVNCIFSSLFAGSLLKSILFSIIKNSTH